MQETKNSEFHSQSQIQINKRQQAKFQKNILDLNKAGLSLLTLCKFEQAIQFFKKAQKILIKQINRSESSPKMIQLQGITYNNLACYYKKTKKPKVALKYLKKALQLQVFKLNNWTSIAGTHLNICAIYSYMKNHQQAANHAQLAINFLNKVDYKQQDQSQQARSYWNVYMLSYYNLAIQKQYLKQFQQSLISYQKAKQVAKISGKRNAGIIISCDQSIQRLQPTIQNLKKKMIDSMKKKQQADEKGYYQYIRKNIKNFGSLRSQNNSSRNQQKVQDYIRKIQVYKEDNQKMTGIKFRTRKVQNINLRESFGQDYYNKNNNSTSFHHTASYKSVTKPRNLRMLTENDIIGRSRYGQPRYVKINQEC